MASIRLQEYIRGISGPCINEQQQVESIQMLSRLLLENETVSFDFILNSNVIQTIIDLLQRDTNPKLQRESACILSTFASMDFNEMSGIDAMQQRTEFCDILIRNKAIPKLVALMSNTNSFRIQGQAIDALGNISDISALMRDVVLSENILDILLSMCQQCKNDTTTTKKCVLIHSMALSKLCNKQPPPQLIYVVLQCEIINELLTHYSDNQEVLLNACWSFAYLAKTLFHENISPFDDSPFGVSVDMDGDDYADDDEGSLSSGDQQMMIYEGKMTRIRHRIRKGFSKVKESLISCCSKLQKEVVRVKESELIKLRKCPSNRYSRVSDDDFLDDYELELEQKELKYAILKTILKMIGVNNEDLKHPIDKIIHCIAANQIFEKEAIKILMNQIERILEEYIKEQSAKNIMIANKVCLIIFDELAFNVNIIQSLKQYGVIALLLEMMKMQQSISRSDDIFMNVILAFLQITKHCNWMQMEYFVDIGFVKPLLILLDDANSINNVNFITLIIKCLDNMLAICERSKKENMCVKCIVDNDGVHKLHHVSENENISDELRALVTIKIIAKYDLNLNASHMDDIMCIRQVPVTTDEFFNLNTMTL